jgi:hypothetical protein
MKTALVSNDSNVVASLQEKPLLKIYIHDRKINPPSGAIRI